MGPKRETCAQEDNLESIVNPNNIRRLHDHIKSVKYYLVKLARPELPSERRFLFAVKSLSTVSGLHEKPIIFPDPVSDWDS